jgi:hypothetical protein
MLPNILTTKGRHIIAVHGHQGVHIGRTVLNSFVTRNGFHLAWDENDLGVIAIYTGEAKFDLQPGDWALIHHSMIHSVTLDTVDGLKIVTDARDAEKRAIEQVELQRQQEAIDKAIAHSGSGKSRKTREA